MLNIKIIEVVYDILDENFLKIVYLFPSKSRYPFAWARNSSQSPASFPSIASILDLITHFSYILLRNLLKAFVSNFP